MSAPRMLYRRAPGILRREVRNELLLLDPRDDSMHVLNPTGALLWERLAQECPGEDLVAAVEAAFEVAPGDDVASDVLRLLTEMTSRDLVRCEPEPS